MSNELTQNYDAFISYSHADKEWVRNSLLPYLERFGVKICIDFRDFEPGSPNPKEISKAIQNSKKVLMVLSPDYFNSRSGWTDFEYEIVQMLDPDNRERRLIPLLKDTCDIPLEIRRLNYIDFADPWDWNISWRQLLTALGVPQLPEGLSSGTSGLWFLAHPYPITPFFTGRAVERKKLKDWLASDKTYSLYMIRALGGFGKSALAWYWLLNDVDSLRWRHVVWWSFYEGEPSFESFLKKALSYLGINPLPFTPRQLADKLLQRLRLPDTLLILDGFERMLRAYASIGAAYFGDDIEHKSGTNERECTSPIAEHFLFRLGTLPGIRSKVLLTSRIRPSITEEPHSSALLQGCHEMELDQLQPSDAIKFFHAQGIRGSRAEIEEACKTYGYHPLSLQLLAGLIVNDLQKPGDIVVASHLDISGDQKNRKHHVLEQAYDNLSPDRKKLLSLIACFRSSETYEALHQITLSAQIGIKDKAKFDRSLHDLMLRGLLHRDPRTNRYDLHPIVRRYAYDREGEEERITTHKHLLNYFAAVPKPRIINSIDDIMQMIELYHQTVRAEQLDNAFDLLSERIADVLYYQFGAYQLYIQLLSAFFDKDVQTSDFIDFPRLRRLHSNHWILNALANSFGRNGQPYLAIKIFTMLNGALARSNDQKNHAIGLGNLAIQQMSVGLFKSAETNLLSRINIAKRTEDRLSEAIGHQELGRLYAYLGEWKRSKDELLIAENLIMRENNSQLAGVNWSYQCFRSLLMIRSSAFSKREKEKQIQEGLECIQRAIDLANKGSQYSYPHKRDFIRNYLMLGSAYRIINVFKDAEFYLSSALANCRESNLVELEADILLELSRIAFATKDQDSALQLILDALTISERCGYVLQEADVRLYFARMNLDNNNSEEAKIHISKVRELSSCISTNNYKYRVACDEAEVYSRMMDM